MIMQGQQPLAQELLTYTPPKDEVRVPVTVSVDTRGTFDEKEIGRELKAVVLGRLQLCPHRRRRPRCTCATTSRSTIEVEITLRLGGKVTEASHDGKVVLGGFSAADWAHTRAIRRSTTART